MNYSRWLLKTDKSNFPVVANSNLKYSFFSLIKITRPSMSIKYAKCEKIRVLVFLN